MSRSYKGSSDQAEESPLLLAYLLAPVTSLFTDPPPPIEGWVEKNKDELSADVTALLELHTEFEQLKALAQRDAQKKADAAEAKASWP